MKVTIPATAQHNGMHAVTLEISDKCPLCNGPRGRIYGNLSYDGSRRLNVDCWENPCGHIDMYSAVRLEGKRVEYKEPTAYMKYEDGTDR